MAQEKFVNLDRLSRKMKESDLDAVVVASPSNFLYLSGAIVITHLPIRDRLELVLWPKEGNPVLILCDHEQSTVREQSWIKEIRTYVEFQALPMQVLAETIREQGLEDGRIGMELDYLRAWYYEELRHFLPETTFVPCDSLMDEVRMIKTQVEIDRLRQAAQLTEQAIWEGLADAHAGETERELARRIIRRVTELGADGFAEVVAAGPNSIHSYPLPSTKLLSPGEVVRVDLKGNFGGVASDVGRMAIVGKLSSAQKDTYRRLVDAHKRVIEGIYPGVSTASIYQEYHTQLQAHGLSLALPFVGHSIGFGGQEFPIIQPLSDQRLSPDMVLSLEPTCDVNGVRYKIEDTIQITECGVKLLSDKFGIDEMITIAA